MFCLANVICTYLVAHLVCNHLRFTASTVARWCRTCRRFWRTLGVLVNKPLSAPLLVAIGGMWWCMPSIRLSAWVEFHLDVILIWTFNPFNVCEAFCLNSFLILQIESPWKVPLHGISQGVGVLQTGFGGQVLSRVEEQLWQLPPCGGRKNARPAGRSYLGKYRDQIYSASSVFFVCILCVVFIDPFRFLFIILPWFGRRHRACV